MLIRCSDLCKYQFDGYCSLENTYTSNISDNMAEISQSGCVYFKPKNKSQGTPNPVQPEPSHQIYF